MLEDCKIRPVTLLDLPLLLQWRNHPRVRQHMFTQHEIQAEEHVRWYAASSQDASKKLCIVEEVNKPIGYVQFNDVSLGGVSHWGFYTAPDAPKGTGKKLGETALHYAFTTLKLRKVCGQVVQTNQASQAFHEKLGFKLEEIMQEQSLHCYGLLASEWFLTHPTQEHVHV